uniref:Uncharacterized protein n=1 Tax=Romanomermis culicivorax TaxID=13658 RepID=A0A915KFF3_ROMCU
MWRVDEETENKKNQNATGVGCLTSRSDTVGDKFEQDAITADLNLPNAPNYKVEKVSFPDPDAPNRQQHQAREWRHWVVINIRENKIDVGDTLTDYKGPSPPAGTVSSVKTGCPLFILKPLDKSKWTKTDYLKARTPKDETFKIGMY